MIARIAGLVVALSAPMWGQWAFTINTTGLTSLTFNGTDYWAAPYSSPNTEQLGAGSDCSSPTLTGLGHDSSASDNSTYVEYTSTGLAKIRYTYSAVDATTLKVTILFTSLDSVNTSCMFAASPLTLLAPSPGFVAAAATFAVDYDHVWAQIVNGASVSFALWSPSISTKGVQVAADSWNAITGQRIQVSSGYSIGSPTAYSFPSNYWVPVAALGTLSMDLYIRGGAAAATVFELAPEAYVAQRAATPTSSAWPDRRPMCRWFMSEASQRTTDNPRGYFSVLLNALDPTAFAAALATKTATVISKCQEINCQAVILWDIEGREFTGWTYIGDPGLISDISPEMSAAIGTSISAFHTAGIKVATTLRPAKLLANNGQLPTCQSSTFVSNDGDHPFRDMMIDTSQPYGSSSKDLVCTSTNTWSTGGQGEISQTQQRSPALIQSLLQSKIDTALGMGLDCVFYVDSTQYVNDGPMDTALWDNLTTANPGCLFIPEFTLIRGYSKTAPYNGDAITSSNVWGEDPTRFSVPVIFNPTLTPLAIRRGDIIGAPQCWFEDQTTMVSYQTSAWSSNSSLAMTDSATSRSLTFTGTPTTIQGTYPVTMRTYFASTAGGLAASTTYCQQVGGVTCFASGTQQSTAALDLSGSSFYQVKYYDFAGTYVAQDSPGSLTGTTGSGSSKISISSKTGK